MLQRSSEHFAEYVPWFIKRGRADLIEKYKIPINEYIDRCENYEKLWGILDQDISQITNGNCHLREVTNTLHQLWMEFQITIL